MSSRASSLFDRVQTPKSDLQITLVDTEKPPSDPPSAYESGNEGGEPIFSGDAAQSNSVRPGPLPRHSTRNSLQKQNTNLSLRNSIREGKANYKYGKYRRDRFQEVPSQERPTVSQRLSSSAVPEDGPLAGETDGTEGISQTTTRQSDGQQQPSQVSANHKSYIHRGKAKASAAKNTITSRKQKRIHRAPTQDSIVDHLYENQRGAFLFGIPKFSSSSLLNFDPMPWQNAEFRTSPVDIRNAQVPDPSWEWAWKNWYVDMSRDVDEEGWEYSFMFQKRFNWHGNHPWCFSFVRRRRWLRKRVRKTGHTRHHETKEPSHELNSDYFTIHRPLSLTTKQQLDVARHPANNADKDNFSDLDPEEQGITDIATLMHHLRKTCHVDRTKLLACRSFVAHGGDDLHYLASEMGEIMSLMVFQASRRQLLADLITAASSPTLDKESDGDGDSGGNSGGATRRIPKEAIEAAEQQVKELEYWSDVKGMAEKGHLSTEELYLDEKFEGVDGTSQPKGPGVRFGSKEDGKGKRDEVGDGGGKVKEVWLKRKGTEESGVSGREEFVDAVEEPSDGD